MIKETTWKKAILIGTGKFILISIGALIFLVGSIIFFSALFHVDPIQNIHQWINYRQEVLDRGDSLSTLLSLPMLLTPFIFLELIMWWHFVYSTKYEGGLI